jgi:hypothetical protein
LKEAAEIAAALALQKVRQVLQKGAIRGLCPGRIAVHHPAIAADQEFLDIPAVSPGKPFSLEVNHAYWACRWAPLTSIFAASQKIHAILRGIAALARDVHRQRHFAPQGAQDIRTAVEAGHLEVIKTFVMG